MSDIRRFEEAEGRDAMVRTLEGDPDFRVLRLVRPIVRNGTLPRSQVMIGCALDVETTGLHHDRHAVIELALQRFWADANGRIVATGRRHSWLEDPGTRITPDITKLTGITQGDVVGRSIDEATASCLIADANFVVAHNAAFDRPFVERRLPLTRDQRWVCSLKDVDWKANGFEGAKLSHLLMEAGWFYRPHRAQTDVDALLHLLDHPLGAGGTVLKEAVDAAVRPTWQVIADGAPFSAKDALRERGYRWDADRRSWSRIVCEADLDDEIAWAVGHVYSGRGRPRLTRITWQERYAESGAR